MNDDGDMAEMYLTEKKERRDNSTNSDICDQNNTSEDVKVGSKSAPISPVASCSGVQKLQRAFSTMSSSKHGSFLSSSGSGENIDQLEMLLEAYFVVIDNTLNKLLSVRKRFTILPYFIAASNTFVYIFDFHDQLKEYIDDTEDLINIKLVRTDC